MRYEAKFIEKLLPLKETNRDGELEAGFKVFKAYFDPKLRNIHTWFARRPAGVARVLNLASVLGTSVSLTTFNNIVGFTSTEEARKRKMPPLLFYTTPKREGISKVLRETQARDPRNIVVVDPMAGGGSIPLESLRLGFRTIAIEYNPVAYLILKATMEFPAKYASAG